MKKLITIHLLTILAFAGYAWHNYNKPVVFQKRVLEHNFEVNGVDNRLVEAIIQVESSGRPNVVSHKGAVGLMQVMPKYWLDYCNLSSAEQLKQPHHNINCGTEVLKNYLKVENNNLRNALARYNGGWRKPKESYAYADKVLDLFTRL